MQHAVIVHHKYISCLQVYHDGSGLTNQLAELDQNRFSAVPRMHQKRGIVEAPMSIDLGKQRMFVGITVEYSMRHESNLGEALTVGFR